MVLGHPSHTYFKSSEVFGLQISQGAIDNILQRTAHRLEPEAEAIRQTVQSSRVVGSDETGVRTGLLRKHSGWMAKTTGSEFTNDEASYGVFQTPQASYYVIDKSRSARVITDVAVDEHKAQSVQCSTFIAISEASDLPCSSVARFAIRH